jgi:cytochrome c-type biogenesis protein CcmH
MTAILAILALGLIVWALTLLAARLPVSARLPLGIAVMLGLTGYLLVGQPGAPGVPVASAPPAGFGDVLEDPRNGMSDRFGDAAQWLGISDGMMRGGNTLAAAQILEQGLRRYPRNIDLWVGYGNALVAHSGGIMTPAAAMAFDRAADIDPGHPAPPFFAGLALAQGGDRSSNCCQMTRAPARSPPDAPWRADLEGRLAQMSPPIASPSAAAAPDQGD